MLQEKIFQALKAKLTDEGKKVTSISDRTLQAEASRLSKQITEESQIESGIVDAIVVLKEFEGNMGAVAAEAAKRNQPQPNQTPQPSPSPAPSPAPSPVDEPEWAKKIREKLESQEQKETEAQKAAARKAKLEDVDKLLKLKGATHDKIRATTLALNQFDESLTAEQIVDKALPLYNKEYTEFFGDSASPKSPSLMSDEQKKTKQAEAMKLLEKSREKLAPKPKQPVA